jgi:segregation and condensation protein A
VEPDTTASPTIKTFSIQTDVFSGPLDLLIELIERRKLLVNDISIAAVTDEYLKYVAEHESQPLREMADFIVLASTLLLLKSKSLLPVLELTESEEESVDSLQERLKRYQIYRGAAKALEALFGKHPSYERRYVPMTQPLFMPDKRTAVDPLRAAMQEILENLPKKPEKPNVRVRTVVTLETMIGQLRDRIERQMRLTFKDFTGGTQERSTVIVGFLAVLEMVKQGSILVRQSARFHDIEIERDSGNAPRYS